MSAILPNGTANIAATNRNAVGIQLSRIASVWNSLPIVGKAMLMAALMNGVENDAIVATINAVIRSDLSSCFSAIF